MVSGKMLIGITGSFGSGKSTVAKMFEEYMDCNVIDADVIGREVLAEPAKDKVEKEFGTSDRKKLAKIVFNDARKLNKLNNIIHPYVRREIRRHIRMSKKRFVFLDSPLIIESNKILKILDKLILVKCDKTLQIKRLEKVGYTSEEVERRMRHQMPLTKKVQFIKYIMSKGKLSLFIIDNNAKMINARSQVMKIAHELQKQG